MKLTYVVEIQITLLLLAGLSLLLAFLKGRNVQ